MMVRVPGDLCFVANCCDRSLRHAGRGVRDHHQRNDAARRDRHTRRSRRRPHDHDVKRTANRDDAGQRHIVEGLGIAADSMHQGMLCRGIERHPIERRSDGCRKRRFRRRHRSCVDAVSGAINRYPDQVTVAMTPDPACRQAPPASQPSRAPPRTSSR
jgi:hypothetical protein